MNWKEHKLVPFDPEIERTFHQRRREQLGLRQVIRMADAGGDGGEQEREERVMDSRDIAMSIYVQPSLDGLNSSIVRPTIRAPNFELKPVMFQMLQIAGQFSGLPTEDPHLYLRLFIEVTDAFKMNRVTDEILKLKLFSYSLRDRARAWLNSLPPDSIATWNDLAEKFLMKYFPPTKNAKLRNDITSFQQLEGESLYETWERHKELLRRCPHHGIPF